MFDPMKHFSSEAFGAYLKQEHPALYVEAVRPWVEVHTLSEPVGSVPDALWSGEVMFKPKGTPLHGGEVLFSSAGHNSSAELFAALNTIAVERQVIERADGYYWIRPYDDSDWEIALWSSDGWHMRDERVWDADLAGIDERKIERGS
tara:strand:+ start:4003 stop:4443 length:441 start_codon:yes stop_codon:yes gene_type:complete